MKLSFTKMQGCANDYIYLDCRKSGVPENIACLLYTSLVREIAVLHGGSVTVERSSENGTTFAVTLPLAQPC